jgi:hypothetical protein
MLGGSLTDSINAQSTCENYVTLHSGDDSGHQAQAPTILDQSTYDPCDGDLVWTFSFCRTAEEEDQNIIKYRITDNGLVTVVFFRDVHSWFYDPDSCYVLSGVHEDVPKSGQHIFQLRREWGDAGLFEDIDGIADYRPGEPD